MKLRNGKTYGEGRRRESDMKLWGAAGLAPLLGLMAGQSMNNGYSRRIEQKVPSKKKPEKKKQKKNKKNQSMKKNVRTTEHTQWVVVKRSHPKYVGPIIRYMDNQKVILDSAAGKQKVYRIGYVGVRSEWVSATPNFSSFDPQQSTAASGTYQAQTVVSDKLFACQTCVIDVHMSNLANEPVLIDLYLFARTKWSDNSIDYVIDESTGNQNYTGSTAAWPAAGVATAGTYGGLNKEMVGFNLGTTYYLRKEARIVKKTELSLDPGQSKTIYMHVKWNQVYNKSVYGATALEYPRGCLELVAVQHGVPARDATAGGASNLATLSPSSVAYVLTRHMHFRQVKGSAADTLRPFQITPGTSVPANADSKSWQEDNGTVQAFTKA